MNGAAKGLIGLALMMVLDAHARIDITPPTVTENLNWVGADITRTLDFCVESVAGANKFSTAVVPYAVMASTAAGPFVLVSGANTIPFTASWTDLATSVDQALTPGVVTAEDKTGDVNGCGGGVNGRLVTFFDNADIVSALPGTYTEQLTVEVSNTSQGRTRFRTVITYTLVIPDSIRVTQLDTINLGAYDGTNDLSGLDSLCVFRRSGGPYGLLVTGNGTGGAFELVSGTSRIPFAVNWNDGNGAAPITSGTVLSARQNTYTLDEFCAGGGANNATLTVDVLAADIETFATVPGAHLGILTITVQPE